MIDPENALIALETFCSGLALQLAIKDEISRLQSKYSQQRVNIYLEQCIDTWLSPLVKSSLKRRKS